MESMESVNVHISTMVALAKKDDPRDLMKYALINARQLQNAGIADAAIRIVTSRYLEVESHLIDDEYN